MENPELREQPHDYLAEIRDEIENVEARMRAEKERTPSNDWLACFFTRLFVHSLVEQGRIDGQIKSEQWKKINGILEPLVAKARAWRTSLRAGQDVPAEAKEEMLSELKSVLEVL